MVKDSQFMSESVHVLGESLPLSEQSMTKLEKLVCRWSVQAGQLYKQKMQVQEENTKIIDFFELIGLKTH